MDHSFLPDTAARGRRLAGEASEKLREGDRQGFREGYEALRKLFCENSDLVPLAESLGGLIRDMGAYHLERSDYIQLSGCVKDVRKLSGRFQGSAALAGDFAFLLAGMWSLKQRLGDLDDWAEYIPEILELRLRFPEHAEILAQYDKISK